MRPVRSGEARQARHRLTVKRLLTVNAARRYRTISLGMSAGSAATSIAAGWWHFTRSVSVRQIPWPSGRSGTQRARWPLRPEADPCETAGACSVRHESGLVSFRMGGAVRLRNVQLSDVDAYERMRCDPVMMAELGGPQPREGIEDKVRRDMADAAADAAWIKMIVPRNDSPSVAGTVALWQHEANGETISEIGWMVLPEFQGQGLGKRAVRALLEAARDDGRWGLVHAFPAISNVASNGICRSVGFRLAGQKDVTFAGQELRTNHWIIDPQMLR
jgi:RimJ/RimL family protein N-acetyltransferase